MRLLQSYGAPKPGPKAEELAKKLATLIIEEGVTYQIAVQALELAEEQLLNNTVPTVIPQKAD